MKFGMITESHMQKYHGMSCKEYSEKFNLRKGQINPHHSKNIIGKGNPRYGVKPSKETREKIRKIHEESGRFKGKGNPMFGKTHTKKVRKIISDKLKISLKGEGNPFFGKKHKKETKRRISKIRIERGLAKGKNNPLYGKKHTEETKRRISEKNKGENNANFGKKLSEKRKRELSKIKKKFFKENPEKHAQYIIAENYKKQKNRRGGYISKKQIEIYESLKQKFSDARLNHPIVTEKRVYFADVGIPSLNLDVEYDCEYWHDEKKDKIRDKDIMDIGWKVIRLKDKHVDKIKGEELLNHVLVLIESKLS